MLQLLNVEKTFYPHTVNEKRALYPLTLELEKGDFVTVIGSNGAGKSTLLGTIAGTVLPDKGQVLLEGEDITYEKEYVRSRQMGRLFQDPLKGTAPHMTISENMALAYLRAKPKRFTMGGLFSWVSTKERDFFRQRLETLELGLENRMETPVGMLSGGQRQALTLLMATLVTPKLLLLDEHTAALDPATGEKVLELTKKVVKEHEITCLMITHDIHSALALGNRTIMMDNGQIVLDLQGEERATMTVEQLLEEFRKNAKKELSNDRMLLG